MLPEILAPASILHIKDLFGLESSNIKGPANNYHKILMFLFLESYDPQERKRIISFSML